MRILFVTLFLGVCSLTFGNNSVVENNFLVGNDLGIKIPAKKKAKMKYTNTMIAYEFYYTVDWLYEETPFSHKLEDYA